jgi:hypothetical protein
MRDGPGRLLKNSFGGHALIATGVALAAAQLSHRDLVGGKDKVCQVQIKISLDARRTGVRP